MKTIALSDNIFYIPATESPLSSDVAVINDGGTHWVFDVGTDPQIPNLINSLSGEINVVISHFHPDHCLNLQHINYTNLYVGPNTYKHIKTGTVVENELKANNIIITNIPNSHAKGSLMLTYGKHAFLGDATYCTTKQGEKVYNAQQLLEEIKMLENTDVEYFCISHDRQFAINKYRIINRLQYIYNLRQPNNPYISINI